MRKITMLFCLVLLTLPVGRKAFSQDAPKDQNAAKAASAPVHYYHLEFVVQQLGSDGKPVNSRTYSTTASTEKMDSYGSIRTGSRIPIVTASHRDASSGGVTTNQFQYVDVGVNIDVRGALQELGNRLSFSLSADISSLADSHGSSDSGEPVIRQNRWQAAVLIPIGKPTVVFASDDLDNKSSMQVVVTATPL